MPARKKQKNILPSPKNISGAQETKVEIPDEAIEYIVSRYLSRRSSEGVPLVVGISTDDVEAVLSLLVEWAAFRNYVKDGVLFIGGSPIG